MLQKSHLAPALLMLWASLAVVAGGCAGGTGSRNPDKPVYTAPLNGSETAKSTPVQNSLAVTPIEQNVEQVVQYPMANPEPTGNRLAISGMPAGYLTAPQRTPYEPSGIAEISATAETSNVVQLPRGEIIVQPIEVADFNDAHRAIHTQYAVAQANEGAQVTIPQTVPAAPAIAAAVEQPEAVPEVTATAQEQTPVAKPTKARPTKAQPTTAKKQLTTTEDATAAKKEDATAQPAQVNESVPAQSPAAQTMPAPVEAQPKAPATAEATPPDAVKKPATNSAATAKKPAPSKAKTAQATPSQASSATAAKPQAGKKTQPAKQWPRGAHQAKELPRIPELVATPAPETQPENKKQRPQNVGECLVTLHVDNQPATKALELLSRQADVIMAVSPGVEGNVTLNVENKSLDKTLQILARAAKLVIQREGDVIYVNSEEDGLPIRVYHLSYISAKEAKEAVGTLISDKGKVTASQEGTDEIKSYVSGTSSAGGSGGSGGSSTSIQGLNASAGGNFIIVQDYEQRLLQIERTLAQIDVQPVQLLIEAVIVQVKLSKDMELGANYAVLDQAGNAVGVFGNGSLINAATGFPPASVITTAGKLSTGLAESTNGIKLGWGTSNVAGILKALEGYGETKILASPRLMVLNKQLAELHLGDQLGYYTSTVSQTSTTQTVNYMNIGTQLRLRPEVMADGMIRMTVHPERSTGHLDDNNIPQTNTAQVTNTVMIPDGKTMVIGGLMDTERSQDWEGIPLLSRIPYLGYLFRHTTDTLTKKELVIIITPHIWRPQCPTALNYLGQPRSECLDQRVRQEAPFLPNPNERSLYESVAPSCRCPAPAAPVR